MDLNEVIKTGSITKLDALLSLREYSTHELKDAATSALKYDQWVILELLAGHLQHISSKIVDGGNTDPNHSLGGLMDSVTPILENVIQPGSTLSKVINDISNSNVDHVSSSILVVGQPTTLISDFTVEINNNETIGKQIATALKKYLISIDSTEWAEDITITGFVKDGYREYNGSVLPKYELQVKHLVF